ncbi:serine/threonine-protein kinase SMG1-like [Pollicipes pollicipes]|uniref:serine/threonine-protein kinase SMG1-like n=1 Tax=Pollicipes pollicipes TaxID=41117 RepID=UPI001884D603|nr:serine/threonine-protein kinase SMG1-like [Pollicipes pollicipes]
MDGSEMLARRRYGEGADTLRQYVLEHVETPAADQELLRQLSSQVLESYVSIGRYQDALTWRETMETHQLPPHDAILDSIDNIRLLASFADGDYAAVTSHAADLPPGEPAVKSALTSQVYSAATAAALCHDQKSWEAAAGQLAAATAWTARQAHDGATEFPPAVAPATIFSLQVLLQLSEVRDGGPVSSLRLPELAAAGWRAGRLNISTLLQITHWAQCLQALGSVTANDPAAARLRLMAVKRLRRAGDLEPAARLLLRGHRPARGQLQLETALAGLVTGAADRPPLAEARRETAKLLHSLGRPLEAIEVLLATPSGDVTSRTDLLLARWLGGGGASSALDADRVEQYLSAVAPGDLSGVNSHVVPTADMRVGRLLEAAVQRSPEDSKAWYMLADWCYTWGKQAVTDSQCRSADQLVDSRAAVAALLPDAPDEAVTRLTDIVERSHVQTDPDNDIEDDLISSSAWVRAQLATVAPPGRVDQLLELWRAAQSSVYGHLGLAAGAYFRFLQLQQESDTSGCERSTLAALRLLRLIVKHAAELRDQLMEGLADTPAGPWKAIIPQLFARLDHPEPYVRSSIGRLLCAVADDDPQLVIFPAVVGGDGCRATPDTEGEPTEVDGDQEVACRLDCYAGLVDTLRRRNPAAMADVTVMVRELRRVTLLWDELWAGALAQHQPEAARRLAALAAELQKVAEREALSEDERAAIAADKYSIAVRPILYVLEKIHAITSVPAETPHEETFQKLYQADIEVALAGLREPAEPWTPRAAWEPFRRLAAALQQRMSGRAAQALSLDDISPVLAGLRDTAVCMPGVAGACGLMVSAIERSVLILPTKTKPKKLQLCGSDGRRYAYLFKGLEDLHLDERVMQLLSITNQMLAKQTEDVERYRARGYAVVPLGPRSGLIQWVEGSTPLFGVYKRWQQRAATANGTAGPLQTPVARPSELFSAKLQPVLRSRGLPADSSRRDLPSDVLVSVLQQLLEETPGDLLASHVMMIGTS